MYLPRLHGLVAGLALIGAATVGASGRASAASGPGAFPHGIGLGAGLHIPLLEGTAFGALARGYGLGLFDVGPTLSLSYDQRVLPWLSLGGTLALRWSEADASKLDAGIRGPPAAGSEAGLYLVSGRVFARPSFIDDFGGDDDAALEMGVELSLGGGPTLFAWRGEVDAAPHFELGGALLWSLHIGCWAATLRIFHSITWQEGLGPLDVGWGPTWMPTIEIRLEKRW